VNGDEFGWDNEFEAHETRVADFAIDNYNVKNRDFMSLCRPEGYAEPSLWDAEGWAWKQKEDVQHPGFLATVGQLVDVSNDVWRHPTFQLDWARICKPCGGDRIRKMARPQVTD